MLGSLNAILLSGFSRLGRPAVSIIDGEGQLQPHVATSSSARRRRWRQDRCQPGSRPQGSPRSRSISGMMACRLESGLLPRPGRDARVVGIVKPHPQVPRTLRPGQRLVVCTFFSTRGDLPAAVRDRGFDDARDKLGRLLHPGRSRRPLATVASLIGTGLWSRAGQDVSESTQLSSTPAIAVRAAPAMSRSCCARIRMKLDAPRPDRHPHGGADHSNVYPTWCRADLCTSLRAQTIGGHAEPVQWA